MKYYLELLCCFVKSMFVYYFSCGNDYDCIEEWKVCDGKYVDCQNGLDESSASKINECLNKTLSDHTCRNLKIGYQCSCDQGYRLSSNKHSCEGECVCVSGKKRLWNEDNFHEIYFHLSKYSKNLTKRVLINFYLRSWEFFSKWWTRWTIQMVELLNHSIWKC